MDNVTTYHYEIPSELCVSILKHHQIKYGIRSLIQLRSVSSIFRDSISKVILTIEELDKDIMKYLKNDQLRMFKNLKTLDLSKNEVITNRGLEGLFLNNLNLSYNYKIMGNAIKKMTLHTLFLVNNRKITDDDIKGMRSLHTIDLSLNKIITDNGIKYLPLRALYLYDNNKITIKGLQNTSLHLQTHNMKYQPDAFVANQTYEICKLAAIHNGYALKYIKEQFKTEKICSLAVQQNGLALEYVEKQTEEICKLAVQQNSYALKYVDDEFKEICKMPSATKRIS